MRVNAVNDAPIAKKGDYVLYWMIANRRTQWNHALDHAIARAKDLGVPLLVLEPLRCGYQWASDRMHAFVLQGMRDNAAAFAAAGVTYLPYVEPEQGAGSGLLAALAKHAMMIVTDEQPGFFLPRMVAAAGAALPVLLEQVDSNGLMPLRATEKACPTAAVFRRHVQKTLPAHIGHAPHHKPLSRAKGIAGAHVAGTILRKWPIATEEMLSASRAALAKLPIDHSVAPAQMTGGSVAAQKQLDAFIEMRLASYGDGHNHPDDDAASGLSPWLHFGHVSAHDVAHRVWADCDWDPSRLVNAKVTGSREGWWGVPPSHENFLDELVTWRELGYSFCFLRDDYDQYSSLPDWAKKTLADHAKDERPHRYTPKQLEAAATHDDVWNAAQRQLVSEGRIHNYLRMLWGKKILEWSASPQKALAVLIDLNNKYAVDGRDPNSYSGIFWTLGRFDRPWAPIRPIFGSIRFMSSASTIKKLRMKKYLARWAAQPSLI